MVADRKIAHYLLDYAHPQGGPKARFFTAFGFSPLAPDRLREALLAHPERNSVIAITKTIFGTKSVVQCNIASPDGRNPCIRSVWLLDPDIGTQRFITAYPTSSVSEAITV